MLRTKRRHTYTRRKRRRRRRWRRWNTQCTEHDIATIPNPFFSLFLRLRDSLTIAFISFCSSSRHPFLLLLFLLLLFLFFISLSARLCWLHNVRSIPISFASVIKRRSSSIIFLFAIQRVPSSSFIDPWLISLGTWPTALWPVSNISPISKVLVLTWIYWESSAPKIEWEEADDDANPPFPLLTNNLPTTPFAAVSLFL